MLSTFLSTIGFYNRAKSVGGLASTISNLISHLMSHSDHRIRQLLESLGRRVDCIMAPLNFCLLWSNDKGTAVSDIVFQARDTLVRIERFIHACLLPSNSSSATTLLAAAGALGVGGTGSSVDSIPLSSSAAGVASALNPSATAGGGVGSSSTSGAGASSGGSGGPVLNAPSKRSKEEIELIASTLKTYLKELEFAITSVNLAVSVINAAHAYQPQFTPYQPSAVAAATMAVPAAAPTSMPWFGANPNASNTAPNAISSAASPPPPPPPSMSALMRASDRLRAVHDSSLGGDVTFSFGTLYAYQHPPPHIAFVGIVPPPNPASAIASPPPLPAATASANHFAAPTPADVKRNNRRHVTAANSGDSDDDGLLPINASSSHQISLSPKTTTTAAATAATAGFIDEQYMNRPQHAKPKHASNGDVKHMATNSAAVPTAGGGGGWQLISSMSALKIVRNSSRRVYELHVDDLGAVPSIDDYDLNQNGASPNGSDSGEPDPRHLRSDLDFSIAFRNSTSHALQLPSTAVSGESASGVGGPSISLRSAGGSGGGTVSVVPTSSVIESCFSWVSLFAGQIHTRYAFVLHDVSEQTSIRARKDNLRPIEIMYLVRLCAYENTFFSPAAAAAAAAAANAAASGKGNAAASGAGASSSGGELIGSTLAHLSASDEELWILFGDINLASVASSSAARLPRAAVSQPIAPQPVPIPVSVPVSAPVPTTTASTASRKAPAVASSSRLQPQTVAAPPPVKPASTAQSSSSVLNFLSASTATVAATSRVTPTTAASKPIVSPNQHQLQPPPTRSPQLASANAGRLGLTGGPAPPQSSPPPPPPPQRVVSPAVIALTPTASDADAPFTSVKSSKHKHRSAAAAVTASPPQPHATSKKSQHHSSATATAATSFIDMDEVVVTAAAPKPNAHATVVVSGGDDDLPTTVVVSADVMVSATVDDDFSPFGVFGGGDSKAD